MNTDKLRQRFADELKKRQVNLICPACGKGEMLVSGPFSKTVQDNPGTFSVGGPAIPTFGLVCKNCGHIREFALGPLGLLDEFKPTESGKENENAK